MLAQLLVLAILLLLITTVSSTYARTGSNSTTSPEEQKPTEEKQGGEYSGFEETGEQTEGLPGKEANPTPQAPVSDLNVQEQNKTTTTTETAAIANENRTSGSTLLAGIGAMAAVAIVATVWYFRKRNK